MVPEILWDIEGERDLDIDGLNDNEGDIEADMLNEMLGDKLGDVEGLYDSDGEIDADFDSLRL